MLTHVVVHDSSVFRITSSFSSDNGIICQSNQNLCHHAYETELELNSLNPSQVRRWTLLVQVW